MGGHAFNDYSPPSTAGLTRRQLVALQKWGPETARTVQNISEEMAPRETALQLKLLQDYAKNFSDVGSEVAGREAKASVANDASTIAGGGSDLVAQLLALDKTTNPDLYNSMAVANQGYQSLIGGQDPNKLSGAELANVERGVNRLNARTGNLNTGDATTTAANAMVFGDELAKKRDRFGQALSLFPGIASASRSPIDVQATATGKYSQQPNFGQQQYQGQTGTGTTNALQSQIGSDAQQRQEILAGRRHVEDKIEGSLSACCFIMIAAIEGKELPWWVRFCRDYYYSKQPEVAKGYKKMAKWLVPLMRKHIALRRIIKYTMYNPISWYGAYLVGESKWGWVAKPVKNFWFKIWRNY